MYILMQASTELDPPKHVHHLAFIFAFQDDLSKMKVVFNFLWLITDQVKFNYSLETLSYTSWNIKGVSSKSGTASNIYWQNVFIHKYRLLKIN